MRCASLVAAAAVVGIALTACSDSRESIPTSPDFKPGSPGFTCDFNAAAGLARSYFAQPTQNVAVGKINEMAGTTDPAVRTARGLDVFELVAAGVDVVGTTQVGSDLLNVIGACSRLGQKAAIDYTAALGPQGAFAVRGASSTPVRSKDDFSGVAPPAGMTWSQWLGLPAPDPNPAKDLPDPRAAIYGAPFPVTNDLSPETEVGARGFDWNTLPVAPNFPLNGDGFLALCVGSTTADRIQNNHVEDNAPIPGVLGVATDSPFSLNCTGFDDSGTPLASGLLRRVLDVLTPEPLYAAALGKVTIGTPGGFSHHFVVSPSAILLDIGPVSDGFVGRELDDLTVTATTGLGVPMQRIGLKIEVQTNNGVPAALDGTLTRITDEFGVATFDDLVLNSAGGYNWHVFTESGTAGISDAEATSPTFHIKNKK